MFSLENKMALVTGCSRGIGMEIAIAYARAGADIIGVSKSLTRENSELTAIIEGLGRKFYAYQCDFSNRESVVAFAEKVSIEHKIDILVNNAGTIYREPAVTHAIDAWDSIIETNLSSQFVISQAIGKQMVERKQGKIIFTASLLSFQGGLTVPSYAASKGAVKQLTHALANEWAKDNVQVNAIAPGYIATDNTIALRENETRNASILERIPAGRWGTPSDIAGAAVFLASDASNYVNGIVLPVDGGWLAR
jgi:2-dehydro-3-deoxy-D-gluconate 5-dehydrogenase